MDEIYAIRWGRLFLNGFTENGSTLWTLDEDHAVWVSFIRAEKLTQIIWIIDGIKKSEIVIG